MKVELLKDYLVGCRTRKKGEVLDVSQDLCDELVKAKKAKKL
jgi:hypothetical protein